MRDAVQAVHLKPHTLDVKHRQVREPFHHAPAGRHAVSGPVIQQIGCGAITYLPHTLQVRLAVCGSRQIRPLLGGNLPGEIGLSLAAQLLSLQAKRVTKSSDEA